MSESESSRNAGSSGAPPDPTNSKVGRLVREYDLDGFGERLGQLWVGEDAEEHSLRELADVFNRRILESAMQNAGMDVLEGRPENMYRLLTDETVSGGVRREAERTLERQGVDLEALTRDFVSHQAIHTYLTKYRGVTKRDEPTGAERVKTAHETVQRLRSRLSAVTATTLSTLVKGDFTLGEFSVFVDVRVLCETCGSQYGITDLLDRGGCDCTEE